MPTARRFADVAATLARPDCEGVVKGGCCLLLLRLADKTTPIPDVVRTSEKWGAKFR